MWSGRDICRWRGLGKKGGGAGNKRESRLLPELLSCQTAPFVITCAALFIKNIKRGRDSSQEEGDKH